MFCQDGKAIFLFFCKKVNLIGRSPVRIRMENARKTINDDVSISGFVVVVLHYVAKV